MFLFMILCVTFIICLSIKQNLGHAWLLGPHTLGKLIIFIIIFLNIKQNLSHAWSLKPHTLGKLILLIICLSIICLSIKQNIDRV